LTAWWLDDRQGLPPFALPARTAFPAEQPPAAPLIVMRSHLSDIAVDGTGNYLYRLFIDVARWV
jgi:hypothetical protein